MLNLSTAAEHCKGENKKAAPRICTERVRTSFAGFAPAARGKKAKPEDTPVHGRLTSREREIVQLVAEGRSNKDVAEAFGISVKTVETHRAAIMRKLELGNLSDLVRYAIRNGIIQP